MPLSTFVLGELARSGPLYGLELKRRFETAGIVSWGPVAATSIYRALAGLERKGLARRLPGRLAANRKPYAITEAGRREFEERLRGELATPRTYRNPLNIAVEYAHLLEPRLLGGLMARRLRSLRALEAGISERLGGVFPDRVPEPGEVLATCERILWKTRAEIRFASRMLALARASP
ncbi:MAG TPA: PadR family transcriptional regulator, partial [Spirochaetia bacterium]|nr:PadR family transcriptional regulator [Spirochaetia bacterium]